MKKCVFFQWIFQIAVAALAVTLLSGFTPTLHGSKEDKELLGGFILMLLACRCGLPFALAAGCWFRRSFVRAVLAGALVGVAMELLLFLLSEPEFSPFRMILRDLLIAFPLCAIPCALGAGIVPLQYAAAPPSAGHSGTGRKAEIPAVDEERKNPEGKL